MIPELHAMVFLSVLVTAAWQDARTRSISPVLVYTAVAVSLSMRALVGVEEHMQGLLGLSAALLLAIGLMLARAATGSELRLLLVVGAFLGPRDTVTAVLVAVAVMLVSVTAGALLQRWPGGGTRAARALLTPYSGVGWSEGRMVVTVAGEAAAAKAAPMSPGIAIVLGAVAGWIL